MSENKSLIIIDRSARMTEWNCKLSQYFSNSIDVIHVAIYRESEDVLKRYGINDYIKYYELFENELNRDLNYSLLEQIDKDIIQYSNNRFNLNASIQSDRGFQILSYNEALISAQSHYQAWENIFSKKKIDVIFHEPCSLFFNHIAQILCKKQGGNYLYFGQYASDMDGYHYLNLFNDNYWCPEIERKTKYYLFNPEKIDTQRVRAYLVKFRNSFDVFFGDKLKGKIPLLTILKGAIMEYIAAKKCKYDKLSQNINYWLCVENHYYSRKIKNLIDYKRNNVSFLKQLPNDEKYYYYSFHLEPEAVVLYLADGIYKNQVKLIENIAAALPPGYYLYVKDHPHEYAYRCANDYRRLIDIPNLRLLDQRIPGKKIISNAIGVFTINGTAGFEALLMNKQVFVFGNNYYKICPRVNYVHNIRDLREAIYKLKEVRYEDDINLYAFINAYLESLHKGFANFAMEGIESLGINMGQNLPIVASNIEKLLCTENKS